MSEVRIGQVYEDGRRLGGGSVSVEYARFHVVAVSRTKVTLARMADGVQQSIPRERLGRAPWGLVASAPEEVS